MLASTLALQPELLYDSLSAVMPSNLWPGIGLSFSMRAAKRIVDVLLRHHERPLFLLRFVPVDDEGPPVPQLLTFIS